MKVFLYIRVACAAVSYTHLGLLVFLRRVFLNIPGFGFPIYILQRLHHRILVLLGQRTARKQAGDVYKRQCGCCTPCSTPSEAAR